MLRFLLRFFGMCLLATAFVLFIYDGEKTLVNRHLEFLNVTQVWAIVDQHSLDSAQDWLRQNALWAWDPYMQKILALPTWVVLALVSTILVMLGRKKKKLIGYVRD
jgi:hypothetical protein